MPQSFSYTHSSDFKENQILKVGDVIMFPLEKEKKIFHVVEKDGDKFIVPTILDGIKQNLFAEEYLEDLTFKIFEEFLAQEEVLSLN